MAKYTITYGEKGNSRGGGFTSFWSFFPDWMCSLNNSFYSIKDGQLYRHNDEKNPVKVNFYGQQYTSKITTIFNEHPSDDKIFKTLVLEGTKAWEVSLKTNYTEGTITADEFTQRESRFFAHIRKNEDVADLKGTSAQGIGNIQFITGLNIRFNKIPVALSIGDNLYQETNGNELIGTITAINQANKIITVNAITNTPLLGEFAFGKKDSRLEGAEIRGYYMEVTLEHTGTDGVELFAINSNAVKSYV